MGLYDFTFYDLIRRNAACFTNKTAWLEADDGHNLNFAQYRQEADSLAAGLRAAGVAKGDRIGVIGKNSLAYFLVYGAAAALGAIVLPVNWRLSAEEVRFNLADGSPTVVFADEEFAPLLTEISGQLASVKRFFSLKGGGFAPFQEALGDPAGFEPSAVATDDGFVIIHTAAVAGRPRGALLSHGNLLCANIQWNYCFGLGPRDVHLNLLPLFHVAGLFMAANSFHAGALNVNMSKFDAALAVKLIETHGVTILFDFSPILAGILDEQEKAAASLKTLRAVVGLDSAETIERYQRSTGGIFYAMYGQTETSCVATYGRYSERPGSAGRPIPLAEVLLVDDQDRPVNSGEIGEIVMKGPMVFRGYWNLPDDTAQVFRNGWHHTGDMGRFDSDGFLFFAGRKPEKELIKPGGENVYPAEVEKVVLDHPAVAQTVVFGVPDPKWKEGIKAVCVLKPGYCLEAQELIDFVGARIARYKKPRYVEFVDELPLGADGGVDRSKVKALYGG
jgi:long-chain acyl-CoA synthetase